MREKLLDLMKNEGLKPSQLAELLGINPAGISHILAGRNKPGFDLLQKILREDFPGSTRIGCCSTRIRCTATSHRPIVSSAADEPARVARAATFSALPPVGIRLKKNGSRKRRKTQPAIRHRNNDSRQHCLPPTSNGSSYCMTIRPSKVLRRRQCVKKIRAGCGTEYSILRAQKSRVIFQGNGTGQRVTAKPRTIPAISTTGNKLARQVF